MMQPCFDQQIVQIPKYFKRIYRNPFETKIFNDLEANYESLRTLENLEQFERLLRIMRKKCQTISENPIQSDKS